MQFLQAHQDTVESSRSARKFDPGRTVRYRRTDPRASNIVFGFDRNHWETTNKNIQTQVANGIGGHGKMIHGDRRMTSSRKRSMLESTLSLGNSVSEWKTESTQHYHKHDLKKWGPRSLVQQDSYSWTDENRRQLAALRDANNSHVSPPLSTYVKLPPICSKPDAKAANGYLSTTYVSGDDYEDDEMPHDVRRNKKRHKPAVSDEDDI